MIGVSDVANHETIKQQEPRIMAQFAQDDNMINAYKEKKDLYATIASIVHNNDYWDNMEHRQDGSPNPEGKKRRSNCKSILLGIMYGRGVASIAEQTGCTIPEAQKIIDDFYNGESLRLDIWLSNANIPTHADILHDGRRILTITIR